MLACALEDLVPKKEVMKTTNKTTIITYQAWFAAFVVNSTVDETSFEADQTSFDTDETRFESNQTSFGPNVTTFKANEVTSGSHAFIPMMNTTLSGAVATTFASDAIFFATEQVTSVAEE